MLLMLRLMDRSRAGEQQKAVITVPYTKSVDPAVLHFV